MKLISSEEKLRTPIFWVTEDKAIDPEGFEIKRAIVKHGGSAVVMPVDDQGRILLVRQYRLPVQDYLWELPAGRLDAGETPLQAAQRELREEAGLSATDWRELVTFWASPGFLAEHMTIFLARGLTHGEAEPMEDERIEIRWVAPEDLDQEIKDGKIVDAKTMVGFYRYRAGV